MSDTTPSLYQCQSSLPWKAERENSSKQGYGSAICALSGPRMHGRLPLLGGTCLYLNCISPLQKQEDWSKPASRGILAKECTTGCLTLSHDQHYAGK